MYEEKFLENPREPLGTEKKLGKSSKTNLRKTDRNYRQNLEWPLGKLREKYKKELLQKYWRQLRVKSPEILWQKTREKSGCSSRQKPLAISRKELWCNFGYHLRRNPRGTTRIYSEKNLLENFRNDVINPKNWKEFHEETGNDLLWSYRKKLLAWRTLGRNSGKNPGYKPSEEHMTES